MTAIKLTDNGLVRGLSNTNPKVFDPIVNMVPIN